jgi:hypothetical protein
MGRFGHNLVTHTLEEPNMNEPTSAPESGPVEDRKELIEGSRSIEWIVPVQPIIFDPYVPGGSDLPMSTSSVDDGASSADSGQVDAQPTTQPETNP